MILFVANFRSPYLTSTNNWVGAANEVSRHSLLHMGWVAFQFISLSSNAKEPFESLLIECRLQTGNRKLSVFFNF